MSTIVVLADFHISRVATWFGAAVYGVVLGRGNDTEVLGIVALHALNESGAQARRSEKDLRRKSPGRVPNEDRERY